MRAKLIDSNRHFYSQRRSTSYRRSGHGALVLETLVSLFVGLLTGAALLILVQLTMTQRSTTMGPANSDAEDRLQLEKVSDSLRDAQSYLSGSNKVCFSAAAASDITIYSDTTGDTLRTWLDTTVSPAALKQTQTTSGVATTTVLLSGVSALQFTYYKEAAVDYNAPLSGWVTTTSPSAPTSAELPQLGAVQIALTVTINGSSRQLTTFVRFRNSPYQ
jgi:hypothetical protein